MFNYNLFFFTCLFLATGTRAEFSNLLINTPANNCQELFDYFGDTNLCDQVGYDVPKSGTIICEQTFPACSDQSLTFCALDDCCTKTAPVEGTCQEFFDATSLTVCVDNGWTGNLDASILCPEGGCDLATCCGSIAPSCKALFALIENPVAAKDTSTIAGEYSCNTGLWLSPISDWETFSTPLVANDFLRSDCCVKKETCGLLYESLDGLELTCENRGYGDSASSDYICDTTENKPCTVTQCCAREESCVAYNFLANGESLTGTAQTAQCQDNGYAYSQPFARRQCYGGKCAHKDCCIRQRNCNAYSADNGRICQNQGYPLYNALDTDCFRGICDRSTCCSLGCDDAFGFDPFKRVCYGFARVFGNRYDSDNQIGSQNINYYDYPLFKDWEGVKTEVITDVSQFEPFFVDYGITDPIDSVNDVFVIYGTATDETIYFALGFTLDGGFTYQASQFKFYLPKAQIALWPLSPSYDGTSTVFWDPSTVSTSTAFAGVALDPYYV